MSKEIDKMKRNKILQRMSFSKRLFFSVTFLFFIFILCFIFYQYSRERSFRVVLLHTKLQDYNHRLAEDLDHWSELPKEKIGDYVHKHPIKGLRVTLIKEDGTVFYDNFSTRAYSNNHSDRVEFRTAIEKGEGYSINRLSESVGDNYFYSASYFPAHHMVVRSSLPYNIKLIDDLEVNTEFLWFTFITTLLLIFIIYRFTAKLGVNITRLKEFSMRIDSGKPISDDWRDRFPNDELGEISQEIVRLYQQLEKSKEDKNRLKRQLTQNIAHELKTPVSSIQGYLETLLTSKRLTEENRARFLKHCYVQSNRLANLLRDISVLTRIDEVPQMFVMETVNVTHIAQEIQLELSLQLQEKKSTISLFLPNEISVPGNASLIYSIFRNLADNAIAYGGTGLEIQIRLLAQDAQQYTFSFLDNGIGVAPEHLEKLFERFYRVDKGRSRKLGGTGLGLAIVKNAVLLHGGFIYAREPASGGLEFVFTLSRKGGIV
ncbi:MAG: ATP-binding protein [Bacteroidaceae bacterium]